ncbi:TPA: hypothetical protein N0H37_001621 [Pseudomonas aeruginosa]|uniref:hypothetical protein n=1 Tax=Pseudomonas aeruginosa TaxID=287 RepID=UPI001ADC54C5|nr:hypothetical protein [Pseudomonas aeruginosa]MBO8348298.1 hypothetical protein [Pseudomonas aeruginosa]MDG4430773.1 hypothetical protein [Pseudomonas aeruginosa]QUR96798.1 hypothetical protein IFJ80_22965 [Pseudomonas aeruginosa]QUS22673.1 hypothetical protein IFJ78_18835 [Pseudomonas aeruginosa]HCF1421617.1 hypothetical protein [Pseudomonas aeruginosa]
MARARNIKPGLFENEDLMELGPFDRLLFIGLWTLADREGRLEDRPKRIKIKLFPGDDYDVDQGLAALAARGFITRYEVQGFAVVEVANFHKHQKPHGTEKDSVLPDVNGFLTVNERGKGGCVTGKKRMVHVNAEAATEGDNSGPNVIDACATEENNVNPTLDHCSLTVDPPSDNALILRFTDSLIQDQETLGDSGESPTASDDLAGREKPPAEERSEYSEDFNRFWSEYPRRHRSGSKKPAWRAWKARLRAGVKPEELIQAAKNYHDLMSTEGRVGTQYVRRPETFIGPDEHWQECVGKLSPASACPGSGGKRYPFIPPRGYQLEDHEFWHPQMTDTVLSTRTHDFSTLERLPDGEGAC